MLIITKSVLLEKQSAVAALAYVNNGFDMAIRVEDG